LIVEWSSWELDRLLPHSKKPSPESRFLGIWPWSRLGKFPPSHNLHFQGVCASGILDLQVSMLSEQELTTILQMLQKLCQHAGVNVDSSKQEVQSFSKTTDVHKLASELEDKLPED
jgi:hypothetical protein